MKNYKKISVVVLYMLFILVGFVYGYNKGKDISDDNKNIAHEKNGIDVQVEDEKVIKHEEKITPSTLLEYVYYYTKCNHTITEVKKPTGDIIGMNEEKFMRYITINCPQWELISFSSNKIVMSIKKHHLCPNHYIIGVENDKIAVYKIGKDGKKVLFKIVNHSVKLLNEIDQRKLKEGITVDSKEEMVEVLENFSS